MRRAARARRSSPAAQRVASRPASWFEPVYTGQASGGSRRALRVGKRSPASQDVVQLRAVGRVHRLDLAALKLVMVVGRDRRIVAQVAILDDRVAHVDAKA